MGSAKNKLKAGSLLAGTIASAAAVGAQQASANLLSDWWFGKSEDIKPKNEPNTGIGSFLKGFIGKAALYGVTAGALSFVSKSTDDIEEITNTLAETFKDYAVPLLKKTSNFILDFAGDHPAWVLAVPLTMGIIHIYRRLYYEYSKKEEYKAFNKVLTEILEEKKGSEIIKELKKIKNSQKLKDN